MPTYDYECEKCGYSFEAFHSMSDPSIKDCPECHSQNTVKRLIGCGAGIIFKGSGFYETDYKRKSSSDSSSSHRTSTKTESKSESKTENKSSDSGKTNGEAKTPKSKEAA